MHKNNDLSYMRGSVIGEAIEIECQLEQILIQHYGETFRRVVFDKVAMAYDFYKKAMGVASLLKTACDTLKNKTPLSNTDKEILSRLDTYKDDMAKFHEDIISYRNILAHAKKDWDSNGKLQLKGFKESDTINITRDWLMQMRSNLAKYRGIFNDVINENLLSIINCNSQNFI